jgi:AraC-like DNA-binding protein
MNFIEGIILSGSILAFLAGLFVLFKSSFVPNIWLGLLLLTISYYLFFSVLYWSRFNEELYVQLMFSYLFPMSVFGPLFYLYIRSLVTRKKLKYIDLVHILPLIIFIVTFWGYYALPLDQKLIAIKETRVSEYLISIFTKLDWLFCIIMLFYTITSYSVFKNKIEKDVDLIIWLKAVHIVFTVFVLSFFIYYLLYYTNVLTIEQDYFITFVMIVFLFLTIYFCYQYPNIFNGKSIKNVIPFIKYQRTGLSEQFSSDLKNQLMYLMDTEKPYLDCMLRLNDLADMLNISRNHASQVINEHFELSFFEFVNKYRIEDAIKLLELDNHSLTITDIAFEVGFNNRVSFYKAFKNAAGVTPLEYREHIMSTTS